MTTTGAECDAPPRHVCAAFGIPAAEPERLTGSSAWRCGDVLLKPVSDRAHAVWLAGVLGRLEAPELRIARPVRSTDGRTLVAGWQAYRYLDGRPRDRPDELVLASVKLHRAAAELTELPPLGSRGGIGATADRLAWGEQETHLDEDRGGRWFEVLAGARRPIALPDQLVHAELFDSVLFAEESAPGIVDFVPYHRPAEWGAAVVAVDALTRGGSDGELLRRWAHLPEWSQLLLRAMLFRLAGHALDATAGRAELDRLLRTAHRVSELL